jgi:hypothetical protein
MAKTALERLGALRRTVANVAIVYSPLLIAPPHMWDNTVNQNVLYIIYRILSMLMLIASRFVNLHHCTEKSDYNLM